MINAIHNKLVKEQASSRVMSRAPSDSDFSTVLKSAERKLPATDLDEIFHRAAERYQVPVDLLKAVAKAESGFNPNAVSAAGAQGVMQLMPATAAGLGVTNSFDPEQNIMGGAQYLRSMLNRYDGNVTLTLAAYNAGSGNVKKYGGVPPFPETQNYIKKVLGNMGQDLTVPVVSGASAGMQGLSSQISNAFGMTDLSALSQTLLNMAEGESLPPEDYKTMVLRWKSELEMRVFTQLVGENEEEAASSIF